MKAAMSDRVKQWLSNRKTREEMRLAVDALHHSEVDEIEVTIDGVKYMIRFLTRADQ